MERNGVLKKVGKYRFRAFGKYNYAPLYDLYQYAQMTDEDILIVDADHGCDPTFKGTDHTREYIPILMYGKGLKQGTDLGTRPTFADIGKTVEEYLLGGCVDDEKAIGKSFLQDIM